MKKYNDKIIYIVYTTETYALISYNEDKSKAFKVDLSDIK
jgi:hypothetical protein